MKIQVGFISPNPFSNQFLVSRRDANEHMVYLFDPYCLEPISILQFEHSSRGLLMIPNEDKSPEFLYLDSEFELLKYSIQTHSSRITKPTIKNESNFFQSLYGKDIFTKDEQVVKIEALQVSQFEILDIPSHILPKPSKFIESFMENLLEPRGINEQAVPAIDKEWNGDSAIDKEWDGIIPQDEEEEEEEKDFSKPIREFEFLDDLFKSLDFFKQ
jgi:hypothetical protein